MEGRDGSKTLQLRAHARPGARDPCGQGGPGGTGSAMRASVLQMLVGGHADGPQAPRQPPAGEGPQQSGQVTGNSPGAQVGVLPAQGVRLHEELECAHDVRRLLRAERSVSARKAPSSAPAPGPSRLSSKAPTSLAQKLPSGCHLGLKAVAEGWGAGR